MSKNKVPLVRDLVIDDEFGFIEANKTVKDASLMMKEKAIPDLVVINNLNDKNVLGVIADFDIVTGLIAEDKPAKETNVKDIMYTISPVNLDTTVEDAFNRMHDLDVPIVPVVDKDKLVGVVTISDTWGMIPEKYEDIKGLISVSDPRFANFFFTVIMSILYLFCAIFLPMMDLVGYFKADIAGLSSFSGTATYYLFDVRGETFVIRYLDFTGSTAPWILITVYSIIFLAIGIISTLMILLWAYGDYHLIKTKRNWQNVGLIIGILNIIVLWLLFSFVMFFSGVRTSSPQIDMLGLFMNVLGIIFLLLAVGRDIIFKQKVISSSPGVN